MLMIAPPEVIAAAATLQPQNAPLRLTAIISVKKASSIAPIGRQAEKPALLTYTSN
jgi:hypothetical protein